MDRAMKTGTLKYYEDSDVLYFFLKKGAETKSIEAAPGITVELNQKNQVIGIEILEATKFIQDYVMKDISKSLELADS